MEAAQRIRAAVNAVEALRNSARRREPLNEAVLAVKRFQAKRFAHTYGDILCEGHVFAQPAVFFLEELYGERDFSQRDQQFARIAGALQRMLPDDAVNTAVTLAELHALTESLDHHMALAWQATAPDSRPVERYLAAWRSVGRSDQRQQQLDTVLRLGRELGRLTRKPALRVLLRMMRGPAAAAGLSDLQQFLESGFEHFANMGAAQVPEFLALIEQRESALLRALFAADPASGTALLEGASGKAP